MSLRPAAALAVALLLTACRTLPPPAARLSPDDPRPAALLGALRSLAETRHALRCRARVSVEGTSGGSFARQLVLLERPARLRVEVLGLLGQRVAVLATDGSEYQLYRPEAPALEQGPVDERVLCETLGLALTPGEAVRLALGTPLAAGDAPRPERASALDDGAVIRIELSDPRRTLEFADGGTLSRYALEDEAGRPVLDARFDDYRDVQGTPFAHGIEVRFPGAGTSAAIRFSSVELNPEIPEALFRLEHAS